MLTHEKDRIFKNYQLKPTKMLQMIESYDFKNLITDFFPESSIIKGFRKLINLIN